MRGEDLTTELLLRAYASGIFPMAERRDDPEVFWVDPQMRGVMPLGGFHMSRSLRRTILSERFRPTVDRDFAGVVDGCADRPDTWINGAIRRAYLGLHAIGQAHSLEVWEGGRLAGGIYGVTLGAAFFGESMFSRARDASKVALCYLTDALAQAGFSLFDVQFLTDHLASLGAVEMTRADYHDRLRRALSVVDVPVFPTALPTAQVLVQRMTQTS